jgi:hypothetical protein
MVPVVTPAVKVNEVDTPKFVPATVGWVDGAGETFAPAKVNACEPVYPVATLL